MKLTTLKSFLAAAAILVLPAAAHALCFDLNSLTPTGPTSGNTPGPNGDGFLYKYNTDGAKEEGATSLFSTSITDLTATVSWDANTLVDLDTIFLKAANFFVAFDVSGVDWSLYDCFSVTQNYIMKNRSFNGISHVELVGGTTSVPDGGLTVILLGAALATLGAIKRKTRS